MLTSRILVSTCSFSKATLRFGDSILPRCDGRSPHRSRLPHQTHQVRTSIFSRRTIAANGGEGPNAKSVPGQKVSTFTWGRFAYYFKVARLPFLVVAIYGFGYRQGVTDTVRNPLKLQQGTFETLLMEMGVDSEKDVEIVSDKNVAGFSTLRWFLGSKTLQVADPRALEVANVGREVIQAARKYVRAKLDEAVGKVGEKYKGIYMKNEDLVRKLNEDSEVAFWVQALERVEGASFEGVENWQYVLVDTPVPNAFVSEMLPQRFFVTTGLFDKIVRSNDELAMILGHEISHLVMGHLTQNSGMEAFLRGLEILILMLDPTEGLLSLGVAGFLASSREALVAAHSRSNETEADNIGCQLAAMCCYDTKRGAEVFRKMQEAEAEAGKSQHGLLSSHPASQERYEALKTMAETNNYDQFSYCNTLRRRIARALASNN